MFAHLAASDDPLFVAEDAQHGLTGRMVVAVRSGRELMGSIWVACSAPLDRSASAALADGARTVALHLLRSRASADLERQVETELVIRLLEGTADAATATSRLGLPLSPLRVIAIQAFIGAERDATLLLAFERATTGFGWSRPGRSALAGNTVYTLLPGERAATARRWVTGLRAALPERVTMLAGISGVASVTDLPAARREADECLALHEVSPRDSTPGLRRVLGRHPAAAAAHGGAVRSLPGPGTGGRVAPPRPRPRHRIRGDVAGLAGGPGRSSRGRPQVGGAREHRAIPAAQNGRDHRPGVARRQEAACHDDRPCGHRQRLTIALSRCDKARERRCLVLANPAVAIYTTMELSNQ